MYHPNNAYLLNAENAENFESIIFRDQFSDC